MHPPSAASSLLLAVDTVFIHVYSCILEGYRAGDATPPAASFLKPHGGVRLVDGSVLVGHGVRVEPLRRGRGGPAACDTRAAAAGRACVAARRASAARGGATRRAEFRRAQEERGGGRHQLRGHGR